MNGFRPDKAKLYHPKMPATWWLKKRRYFLFMMRELSSVFIAIFLLVYLREIYQLASGPDAYGAYVEKLSSPGWIFFHLIALVFALYHSYTWFESSAIVLPLRIGGQVVSRKVVMAANIGVMIVVSLVIFTFFITLQG